MNFIAPISQECKAGIIGHVNLPAPASSIHRYPLLHLLAALVCGIVVERWLISALPVPVWLGMGVLALAGWRWFRGDLRAGWILMLLVWAAVGAARHHDHWHRYLEQDVGNLEIDDKLPVAIRIQLQTSPEATPLAEPDPLSTMPVGVQSRFHARVLQLRNRRTWEAASGRIAVRADGHVLQHSVGDVVEVFGVLSRLPAPMNPGEPDRRITHRNRRTLCRLDISHPDCIRTIRSNSKSLSSWLGWLRGGGLSQLDRYVGRTRSPLAGALLLGARDRLDYDRVEQFFHTGTMHLLAISGLHVGILAWAFFFLANRTSSRRTILLSLMVCTLIYCHLTGLRAPVLRAATLVELICISSLLRRKFSALNALAAAAILILLFRPGAVAVPGAQLSFLAVTTLIWLSHASMPRRMEGLEKLVNESRSTSRRIGMSITHRLGQLGLAGFAIWLAALPLVMFWFHLCSPVALALNVVLTLPITIGLLSGFGVLLSGAIASPLAAVCGRLCAGCLALVESIVQFSHDLPGAYFWVSQTSGLWCTTFYVGLVAFFVLPSLQFNKRLVVAWFMLWTTLPIIVRWTDQQWPSGPQELRCTFLSVGHGTCAVLEMPDGEVLIYDAGRMGIPSSGVNVVSEFLWSRGITHVDGILMSHADADHYNLVPGLMNRFSVGEVFVASRMLENEGRGVAILRDAIRQASVPIRQLQTNDVLVFGAAWVRVLHPLAEGVPGSDNANSVVINVEFQGRRILLPGDLESPGLEDVMAELPLDVDLAMAPHHGSLRSDPRGFTGWCTPEFVVISGGRDSRHAQIRRAFEHGGAIVLHTAYDGAVTATVSEHQIRLESFLGGSVGAADEEPKMAASLKSELDGKLSQIRRIGR